MPEPFKNLFNKPLIGRMGRQFALASPAFDEAGFVKAAARKLSSLELKQRSEQITAAMVDFLPDDFEQAAEILLASLGPASEAEIDTNKGTPAASDDAGLDGWAIMPMTHYVGTCGLEHFDLSLSLLREMTKRFTSEWGIRFFLLADTPRTLAVLQGWTDDPSMHVRRLISEGTRPRLPWGMQLPEFIDNPKPLLPLLEALRDDDEEYVRRSVANNLNDIAKDHPSLVAKTAKKWLRRASNDRERLVRHACRTLIKQGHAETLSALGYSEPDLKLQRLKIFTPQVTFGEALEFELAFMSTAKKPQPLIVDYIVHHRKANGSTSPKVFKWKTMTLAAGEKHTATRKHPMRKITTRVYYPGKHRLEIVVNGVSVGRRDFELVM